MSRTKLYYQEEPLHLSIITTTVCPRSNDSFYKEIAIQNGPLLLGHTVLPAGVYAGNRGGATEPSRLCDGGPSYVQGRLTREI